MGTGIQWTDETWNPTIGCSLVSPGCKNCYAMGVAHDIFTDPRIKPGTKARYEGTTVKINKRSVWTNTIVESNDQLVKPLSWRKARMIFVNSMSDLFHPGVSIKFRDRIYAVMALTPRHTYQVLTKRPDQMNRYLTDEGLPDRIIRAAYDFEESWRKKIEANPLNDLKLPLSNVWHGVSVEDQQRAEERIPPLLTTPSAIRFLSCEPLLGRLSLRPFDNFDSGQWGQGWMNWLDWVIVGGESGSYSRPCRIEWIKELIRDGVRAQTPVFVKQLGAVSIDEIDRRMKFKSPKGGDPDEWPAAIRVQQWPVQELGERAEVDHGSDPKTEEGTSTDENLFPNEAIGLVADPEPEGGRTDDLETGTDPGDGDRTESRDQEERKQETPEAPAGTDAEGDGLTQEGSENVV